MYYFPIKYQIGGQQVLVYQESLAGEVQRYTDLDGNTVTLPSAIEVVVIDRSPTPPSWAIDGMTYVQLGYVARIDGALIYAEVTRFCDVDGNDTQFPGPDQLKSISVLSLYAPPPPWGK